MLLDLVVCSGDSCSSGSGSGGVSIVHFHGPKIEDYRSFLYDGTVSNEQYLPLLQHCNSDSSSGGIII